MPSPSMKYLLTSLPLLAVLLMGTGSAFAQGTIPGVEDQTLYNERIQDVIESDKPALKAPYQKIEKPKIEEISFLSKDVFLKTTFKPEPPKAIPLAAVKPEPLKNNFLKLGIGRYITPFGQVYIHNGIDKRLNYGVDYTHRSVYQDALTLRKYNLNNLSGVLSTSDNVQTIGARINFHRMGYFFYADTVLSNDAQAREDSLKMAYTEFDGTVFALTNYDTDQAFQYSAGATVRYYADRNTNRETQIKLAPTGSYRITDASRIGANTEVSYIRADLSDIGQNRFYVDLNPYITLKAGDFNLHAGIRFNYFSNSVDSLNYQNLGPDVEASYAVQPGQFEVFAGASSGMINNNYGMMRRLNPYIQDSILVKPTTTRFNVFVGARGNIGGELDYTARLYYRQITNQLIFFTPEQGYYFNALYDSLMTVTGAQLELNYRLNEQVKAGATFNFNVYNTSTVEKYFHAAPLRLEVFGIYSLDEKLTARADLNLYGPTPMSIDSLGDVIRRNPFVNVALSGDYRITKQFSVFVTVNNLLSNKYYRWYNYLERPIDFNAGLTLGF